MNVVVERCAGLDVHKKTVVACRLLRNPDGRTEKVIRSFGTMTGDLLLLGDWLRAGGVTQVAMESTGVYWKPIFNLLEAEFEIILVNARHIKYVLGRKTDVKDAEWIADLLQHGLLKASFIPPAPQRALRDLVRYRLQLTQERTREINRVHKVLEDANIKLGTVASDVLGASGRAMLEAMVNGEDKPQTLAELAKASLRKKIVELERALTGRVQAYPSLIVASPFGAYR